MSTSSYDTRWARRKLDRARAHLADLEHAVAGWVDPRTYPLDLVLADGGRRVDVALVLDELPPLENWSLIVGDCIHNIRTALDVFVWMNSTVLPESDRRNVAYPFLPAADEDEDPDASDRLEDHVRDTRRRIERRVAGLTEPLRSRVLDNMRWATLLDDDGDIVRHQRLPLIRELDDIDKHRLALELESSRSVTHIDVRGWGLHGDRVPIAVEWIDGVDMPRDAGERVPIATCWPEGVIDCLQGSGHLSLHVRVRVLDVSLEVPSSLEMFVEDVSSLLDVLAAPIGHSANSDL